MNMLLDNGAQIETRDKEGRTSLWSAAANGNTDVVRALVSAGADVNTQTNRVSSALNIASKEGYVDIVNILLDNGTQIETGDKEGGTPLWFAAANGHTDVVRALVSAGADVNIQRNDDVSALGFASCEGHIDIVNILLDNGVQVETRDKEGRTPLWFAAAFGHTDVVRALVSPGADVNIQHNDGTSALNIASNEGHIDIVNMLLENGAQIETRDKEGRTPLWYAAANGHTDVVRALVSAGADVNIQRNDGVSALGFSSQEGYIDIVNRLLDNGAQTETRDNYSGRTPLLVAASKGQTDVVRALVSDGADVNTQTNRCSSAVCFASCEGYIDIVKMLLENGVQIETRDNEGRIPLWSAAAKGQADVARALVSPGADVNIQHNDGTSALNVASNEGYIDIVNMLLDNGAQTETRDNHGRIPVCIAGRKGRKEAVMTLTRYRAHLRHLEYECGDPLGVTAMWCQKDTKEILQLLTENGSCVNPAKHGLGQSALMMAAHRGRFDIVEVLQKDGANIYDRNFDNIQPIDVASYCGHTNIVQFLSSCNNYARPLNRSNLHPPSDARVDCHCNAAMHLTTDLQPMISLLENGADVDAENVDGLRPIHCAVRTGLVELVELLIQHGANVDAADVFGNRPLHEAVCHGLNIVQLLIQREAKLNVQNIDGKTPLHIAVERQQSEVIAFLLSQDADVGLTDVWRNTPLHYFTRELFAVSEVAESIEKVLSGRGQYNVIRNIVDMPMPVTVTTHQISDNQCKEEQNSAVNNITEVALMSSDHTTQAHVPNCFCWEKLDADCYGNTPLHYAVGVYGQLKMFKVNTDVAKTVEVLVKRGADINVQNKDGLTPLHVARGEKAIEACLRHADEQSFTITDNRGRNFWHLLFLTRTQNDVELGTSIRPLIATSDATKYNADDLNRTPLHYVCMSRNSWIRKWNWLAKEYVKNFSDEHVNKRDKFGRTALHYAAIDGNKILRDTLKTKKADNTMPDNYQKTSDEYYEIRWNFNTKLSLLRLTKSSSYIARYHRDISACIHTFFC